MGILLLAIMIASWAVAGAGRQVYSDARAGVGAAKVRTAERVAKVRADKKASKFKRGSATAAVGTVKLTGATARGVRYVGRSLYEGGKAGAAEGRQRYETRTADNAARHRHWRKATYGDPEAVVTGIGGGWQAALGRRIDRSRTCPECGHGNQAAPSRDDCGCPRTSCSCGPRGEYRAEGEPKTSAVEPDWDRVTGPTEADLRAEGDADPIDQDGRRGDGSVPDDEPETGPGPTTGGHWYCPDCLADDVDGPGVCDCRSRGPHSTRLELQDEYGDGSELSPDAARWMPPESVRGAERDITSSNGGNTMTAPTSNGFRASGEASTISGARAAWASFEGYAVEAFDTAGQAEQEAKARMAGAAAMLDVATAAETDAKQQMAAAQTLAASLADSDMGDPQAVADAEAQQEQAAALADAAAELRACAEGAQAEAARQMELAQQLRSAAETSQAHCSTSLAGMNQRMARREAFFND